MAMKKEREVYVIADEEDRHPQTPGALETAASREAVARRAFELFLARGGVHGRDIEDWLRAEREVRGERS
jgi:hypothetical protein